MKKEVWILHNLTKTEEMRHLFKKTLHNVQTSNGIKVLKYQRTLQPEDPKKLTIDVPTHRNNAPIANKASGPFWSRA
jgi:hypothetical protein